MCSEFPYKFITQGGTMSLNYITEGDKIVLQAIVHGVYWRWNLVI